MPRRATCHKPVNNDYKKNNNKTGGITSENGINGMPKTTEENKLKIYSSYTKTGSMTTGENANRGHQGPSFQRVMGTCV